MKQTQITRRDFIKSSGVVAGAGFMGLAGCAAVSTSTADVKWDQTTDVIVVGSGCGLAAAIEAKSAGADTIILERNDWVGGLYSTSGGNSIWGGTKIQKQFDINDTKEAWLEDELHGCNSRGQIDLIKMYMSRADETIEWFEKLGLVWAMGIPYQHPETNRVNRSHFAAPSANYPKSATTRVNRGHAYTTVMHKKVKELGIPVLLKHRMTKVHRDGNGPVVGVEVQTPSGIINIKARKAVILCTGTWTDNERLCGIYDPRIVGPDTYGDGGTPCDNTLFVDSAADGHIAAANVGAAFTDMSFVSYLYIFFGSRSYWGWEPFDPEDGRNLQSGKGIPRTPEFHRATIFVKADGKRFINEMEGAKEFETPSWAANQKLSEPWAGALAENPEWGFTARYLAIPQPRNVWAIADAKIAENLKWPMNEINNPNPKKGLMFDPELVAVANTIEELAAKMNIPAAALKATINEYNEGAAYPDPDGKFGKKGPLSKIETAPFYGLKASLIRHTQRNGARVNTKSQVVAQLQPVADGRTPIALDAEAVIPHLYAAGELGNIMGYRRMHGSLGNYAIAARVAGENAAKERAID